MFFMISGYLFYRTFDIKRTKEKITKRVKTLLVPYLLWNIIYAVFFVLMTLIGLVKNAEIEWNAKIILQTLNSDFSPLWFVKYLMIFSLIAPIMYYVFKNKYVGAIAIMAMIAVNIMCVVFGVLTTPLDVNSNGIVMLNYQYIFYAIGAYAGINYREFVENPTPKKRNISLVVLGALCVLYFLPIFEVNIISSHTFRIAFAISLWFAFDLLPEVRIQSWMKMSFWIYCSHTIVLQCAQGIIGVLLYDLLGGGSIVWIAEWIVLPIAIAIFLLFVGLLAKKYTPKIYNLLTGSRL